MSFGLQVVGDDGYNQIDENYTNLSFIGKATVTCGGSFNTYTQKTYYSGSCTVTSLSGSFNRPLVFINCGTMYAVCYGGTNNNNGTMTFYFATTGTDSFTAYVFDTVTSDNNPYGLQIFNSSGAMTFSSNYRPMRIVTFAKSPNSYLTSNYNGLNVGLPGGQYAACPDIYKTDSSNGQNGSTTFTVRYSEMLKITSTNLSTSWGAVDWIPAMARTNQTQGPNYMVIKVDGL